MATWIIRTKKEPFKTENDHLSPGCKHRRVGVPSEIVDSLLMLEKRHTHVMEKRVYGWCFYPSQAGEGSLLGCALLALDSLDETALFFIATWNSRRSWQK